MNTVNITPSWEAITKMCLEVITNPLADPESKQECRDELIRLAKSVDQQIAEREAYNNSTTTLGDLVEEARKKGEYL